MLLWLKEHLFDQLVKGMFLCLHSTHTGG